MDCPACGSPAQNITAGDFDGISIRCPAKCGDYDISGTVVAMNSAPADLAEALERAKKRPRERERPLITSYDLPP